MGSFEVARIIHLGASSSIEIRFRDGRTKEKAVGSTNPLMVGTTGFRIAHLSMKTVNDLPQVSPKDKVSASVQIVPVVGEKTFAGFGVYPEGWNPLGCSL